MTEDKMAEAERTLSRREPKTLMLSITDRVYITLGLKQLQKDYESGDSPTLQRYAKEVKALRKHLDKVM